MTVLEFTAPDGVTIRCTVFGEAGSTPPVVLHHGFAASTATNWVGPGVVDALVAGGRHVVGIDARGHGLSDKPHDRAFYGESAMARDVVQLIDILGVDDVHLIGYSMGAVVSLLTAAQDRRVARLIVGGVGAGVVEVGGLDTRAMPPAAIVPALLADDPSTVTDPGAARFRAVADASGADRLALAAQLGAVHAGPVPLDRIDVPTLVIAGVDDPLAVRPAVLSDAIAHGTLVTVDGDHLAALRDPRFVSELVSFVS